MHDLVSIIVPVYNVEKYLRRCLNSILNQTYINLEVILVDDGSDDESYEICCNYEREDNRVKVYHKENEGLGLARNYGMKSATGDYLMFVDSDDFLVSDAVEVLYRKSKETDADIVIGNHFYKDKPVAVFLDERLYEGKEIEDVLAVRMMGNSPYTLDGLSYTAWGKLYRTNMLVENELLFQSERRFIWEDLEFNSRVILVARRIFISHYPIYNYCFNEDSLTHIYKPNKIDLIMDMYNLMLNRIISMELSKEAKCRLDNNFIGHIRTCIKLEVFYSKENGFDKAIRNVELICNNRDVQKLLSDYPKEFYSKIQRIYNFFLTKKFVIGIYFLSWLQNKRKKVE